MTCGGSLMRSLPDTASIGSGLKAMLGTRITNGVINARVSRYRKSADSTRPRSWLPSVKLSWPVETHSEIRGACSKNGLGRERISSPGVPSPAHRKPRSQPFPRPWSASGCVDAVDKDLGTPEADIRVESIEAVMSVVDVTTGDQHVRFAFISVPVNVIDVGQDQSSHWRTMTRKRSPSGSIAAW